MVSVLFNSLFVTTMVSCKSTSQVSSKEGYTHWKGGLGRSVVEDKISLSMAKNFFSLLFLDALKETTFVCLKPND